MRRLRRFRAWPAAAGALTLALSGLSAVAYGTPGGSTTHGNAAAAPAPTAKPAVFSDTSRITDPDHVLSAGWRTSTDRAVTTVGDADGLNVVVADASDAYQWRVAASLSEPGFETSEWIGQDCVTGSGRYAAVVYAPWDFANSADAVEHGGFAAVVDLTTGTVRKLAQQVSFAYNSPGCGADDTVVFSAVTAGATGRLLLPVEPHLPEHGELPSHGDRGAALRPGAGARAGDGALLIE